jgi:(2R)-ethylmalonyl-CoA mutase
MSAAGDGKVERDRPWIFRTYAGHSTAAESNKLYRGNLAKGQTGLSVAFDLPTQTGYDPDDVLARGEVGKVGVPVAHLGDMRTLFHGIPLDAHEHVHDDQRHRALASGALCGCGG